MDKLVLQAMEETLHGCIVVGCVDCGCGRAADWCLTVCIKNQKSYGASGVLAVTKTAS